MPRPLDDFADLLTLDEARQVLGVGKHRIRMMADDGLLPVMEFSPKKRRIPKARLREYLETGTWTGKRPAQDLRGLRVA